MQKLEDSTESDGDASSLELDLLQASKQTTGSPSPQTSPTEVGPAFKSDCSQDSRQSVITAHSPPTSPVGDTASFGLGLSQDSRQTTSSIHSLLTCRGCN